MPYALQFCQSFLSFSNFYSSSELRDSIEKEILFFIRSRILARNSQKEKFQMLVSPLEMRYFFGGIISLTLLTWCQCCKSEKAKISFRFLLLLPFWAFRFQSFWSLTKGYLKSCVADFFLLPLPVFAASANNCCCCCFQNCLCSICLSYLLWGLVSRPPPTTTTTTKMLLPLNLKLSQGLSALFVCLFVDSTLIQSLPAAVVCVPWIMARV